MKRHVMPSLSLLLLLVAVAGCQSEKGETTKPLQSDDVTGLPPESQNTNGAEDGASGAAAPAAPSGEGGDGAADPQPAEEPGDPSAPPPDDEGGQSVQNLIDAASMATDACCAAHDTPGCADATVEACVCADDVLPQCCTDSWSPACVEIVRQRHCDPGVRECVCTEWEQSSCCDTDWTNNFCDATAELKCGATIGCHE